MHKNKLSVSCLSLLACTGLFASELNACPVSERVANFPSSFATSATTSITYTLSTKGAFKVTRVLTEDVPAAAASCSIKLEGRYSRNNSYSSLTTLATRSSKNKTVTFSASQLPAVKSYKFRNQTIQPSLHLRTVTTCIDSNGATVLSDTSPVVARYADCGFTRSKVSMASFIASLKRKLKTKAS